MSDLKPYRFKGFQTELGAPKNWDSKRDGNCVGLPVAFVEGTVLSGWRLTIRQRFAILFGANIFLSVFGNSMPPVMLSVQKIKEAV